MKSKSRISLVCAILTVALLCGCDADDIVMTPESSVQTTSANLTTQTSPVQTVPDTIPSSEPEIIYHPEALWTPMSVDTVYNADRDTVIETENGNFLIERYGYYDENGNQIEIAPDQKIALEVFCDMGFLLYNETMGYDGYDEVFYSDLPDEIRSFLSEEMFEFYNHVLHGTHHFIEDWLELQGFEVVKDHICHYSWILSENPPSNYRGSVSVLIITTPRQLAEFKMPYPQATVLFTGAKYEEFAPEIVNPLQ